MAKPSSHPDPKIPSVFVSQKSGMLLQNLYTPGYTQVYMSAMSEMLWMSMIISTLAGFFAVSVVVTAFYLARRPVAGMVGEEDEEHGGVGHAGGGAAGARPRRRQAMNAEQLRLLPVIVHQPEDASSGNEEGSPVTGVQASANATLGEDWHTAGDTKRVCAICLELYEPNDKLRLLPCQHRYHKECIDQWLTSRGALCPVCKHDASTVSPATQAEGADLEAGEGSSGGRRRGLSLLSEEGSIRENIRRASQRVRDFSTRYRSMSGRLFARPGSSSSSSSGVSGGSDRSNTEVSEGTRARLLPLADSNQRSGSTSAAVEIRQQLQEEPSSSSLGNA